jgi:hypothetical protein
MVLARKILRVRTGAINLQCCSDFSFANGGLVAQSVEQCPFNSKTPILAIFSSFYFPFATIAKPLISLVIIRISMSSLVVS